jgi:hypothetical protein
VRIQELVLFRGELSRRLISDGQWTRSPTGDEVTSVKVNATVNRQLEIEVGHLTNRLAVKRFVAWVRPRVAVFNAPPGVHLRLAYGSDAATKPRYDIAAALNAGLPTTWGKASLGATSDSGTTAGTTAAPRRGQQIEVSAWQQRQPVVLPAQGTLAYIDVAGAVLRHLASLRIVNSRHAQVPYVLETDSRHSSVTLQYRTAQKAGHTKLQILGIAAESQVESIGITATEPAYFERSVEVTEAVAGARRGATRRTLGRIVWKRAQGEPVAQFWIPIEPPLTTELEVDIDNGDDAPLTITTVCAQMPVRRIDFEYSPGENLAVYWGNPNASPPRYDLSMIAGQILSSQALPATLGTLERTHEEASKTPKWFWWAAVVAGLIVAAVLARAVMGSPSSDQRA